MRRIRRLGAAFCALAVAAVTIVTAAPQVSAQQAPEIKFEKYTLPNGLDVILHQDNKLPVVNVNLWYHVGSKNEKVGRTGFAHLFEHMMFQGSKNVQGEFLQLAERAGANLQTGGVNGTTDFDRTNYFETVPSESLEYAIWLESDRMGFLLDAMTQEKLNNQIDVVKNEKRQGENAPYGRAFSILFENFFPQGHPYSHMVIGSLDDLTAATLDDVKEFFRTYYTPNNATLTIAGSFDPAQAKALVEKYFGPIAPGPALERPDLWLVRLDAPKRVAVTDRVPQPRLMLAFPGTAYFQDDEPALDVLSSVLGGGKTSRLYKRLVRDMQIASTASASHNSLEISGIFLLDVIARPGQSLVEVERIVDEEIARIAQQGPTPQEVEAAKAELEAAFVNGLQRIGGFGGKADLLNRYNTYLGAPDKLKEDYERYRRVTPESVRAAAQNYINTKNRLAVEYSVEQSSRPTTPEFARTAPAIGTPAAFAPPVPKRKTLANGLEIMVVERRELPTVSAVLVSKAGATADPAGKAGTAWMTAAMLDEGTTTRSAVQIAEQVEQLGSSLGTSGGPEQSTVAVTSLTRNLRPTMEIMADVVLNPAFPAEELERQRKQRLDAIARELQNPAAIAQTLFPKLVFGPDHPYGRVLAGDKTSVEAMTPADLKAYHAANYKPNNSALIFVGDVSLDEASALAEQYLGSWQRGNVAAVKAPTAKLPNEKVVYLIDRQDAQQSQIRIGSIGLPRTSEDYYAVELMNAILGGAFSSRLNLNLRENKGYTYGAFNGFVYRLGGGYWVSSAGVNTPVTDKSLAEFEREIRGITGERPITPEELEQAKANLIRGFAQRFEANAQIAGEIATLFAFGLPPETLTQYSARIDALSAPQLTAAAKKYIDPAKTVVLVVGDRAKIEESVRALNLGRIVVLNPEGQPVGTN
jgi:zinc protease